MINQLYQLPFISIYCRPNWWRIHSPGWVRPLRHQWLVSVISVHHGTTNRVKYKFEPNVSMNMQLKLLIVRDWAPLTPGDSQITETLTCRGNVNQVHAYTFFDYRRGQYIVFMRHPYIFSLCDHCSILNDYECPIFQDKYWFHAFAVH